MGRLTFAPWKFRFRLATLFIAVTIAGIVLPVETDRRRRAWAINELRKLGGEVSTRQLVPRWALRLWIPSFVQANEAEIRFILQPDGTWRPTNSTKPPTDPPVSLEYIRFLTMRAGLRPQNIRLGVVPTSATPHTLTARVAADIRQAGFESVWAAGKAKPSET